MQSGHATDGASMPGRSRKVFIHSEHLMVWFKHILLSSLYKGVGLQVLSTLDTARPLQHIYIQQQHSKHINKIK